ncbi:hypothetical protein SISSUDRAFT_1054395 [Sistotremastrum suecicum HHB10207 ss-3]|uniref:P-loop containing nucleoside triphosphate hydrolase protein n=1 Tax=Sistotremastrum suecicum HHB10207 ss-3 TaxID=1314776 RepID=A0A165YJV7_9AGAM|nr:hypothetical protein SISSUDRAFT_1054395 [Sistotremastrum suecicum HHB10207 ss-3]
MSNNSSDADKKVQNLALQQTNTAISLIPPAYLAELKQHIKTNNHDTHFKVAFQPGQGYGLVYCLEDGCRGLAIPLEAREKVADGGLKDGFGSLKAYRTHIHKHPTHKINRLKRIQAASGQAAPAARLPSQPGPINLASKPAPAARSSMLNRLDSLGSSSPVASPYVSFAQQAQPSASQMPGALKRSSSPDFDQPTAGVKRAKSSASVASTSAPKKPLANTNTNAPVKPEPTPVAAALPPSRSSQGNQNVPTLSPHHVTALEDTARAWWDMLTHLKAQNPRPADFAIRLLNCSSHYERVCKQINDYRAQHGLPLWTSTPVVQHINIQPQVPFTQPVAGPSRMPYGSDTLSQSLAQAAALIRGPNESDDSEGDDPMNGWAAPGVPSALYRSGAGYATASSEGVNEFLKAAAGQELFDGNASVDQSLAALRLKKVGDKLPHMTISLLPHQVLGVDWMLKQELGDYKGGIMADEMGLGKTIQMIATMIMNPPTGRQTQTLIVAPLSLLTQWKAEIEDRTGGHFNCHIHHGQHRKKNKRDLADFDIILTTYDIMKLEWPDPEAEAKKERQAEKRSGRRRKNADDSFIVTSDEDEPRRKKEKKKAPAKRGVLLQIDWWRIVLDEAQCIRNKETRTSRAITEFNAVNRWCLTGTPITNSLRDAYGMIRYLKIRPWWDWVPTLASQRLQTIFKTCLLRRKKDSMLDGKMLITLPAKELSLVKLKFSDAEQDVYDFVQGKAQEKFNEFLREGTVLKNHGCVFTMLLRLRQLCSHPALIAEHADGFRREGEETGPQFSVLENARRLVGEQFVRGLQEKYLRLARAVQVKDEHQNANETMDEVNCSICWDLLERAVITACGHVFCPDYFSKPEIVAVHGDGKCACPMCRTVIYSNMLFDRSAFEPTPAQVSGNRGLTPSEDDDGGILKGLFGKQSIVKACKKGKKRAAASHSTMIDEDEEESEDDEDDNDSLQDFIVADDVEDDDDYNPQQRNRRSADKKPKIANRRGRDVIISDDEDDDMGLLQELSFKRQAKETMRRVTAEGLKFLPSTKLKYMMQQIHQWLKEFPEDKIMLISQWTSLIDLAEQYLVTEDVEFLTYKGSMNQTERDIAVAAFNKDNRHRVMFMSLKAGGVGLNLTRANRVISLDLAWSTAVEAQAFARVHRIGQTKEVIIERLVIENTVEDRVLALQEKKAQLAAGALGEGDGMKIGRLTVTDLARLFGLNAHGGRLAVGE